MFSPSEEEEDEEGEGEGDVFAHLATFAMLFCTTRHVGCYKGLWVYHF